jgi:hypothetical protein
MGHANSTAGFIVGEMLFFTVLHLSSGGASYGPVAYWLVVAAFSAFIIMEAVLPA